MAREDLLFGTRGHFDSTCRIARVKGATMRPGELRLKGRKKRPLEQLRTTSEVFHKIGMRATVEKLMLRPC